MNIADTCATSSRCMADRQPGTDGPDVEFISLAGMLFDEVPSVHVRELTLNEPNLTLNKISSRGAIEMGSRT